MHPIVRPARFAPVLPPAWVSSIRARLMLLVLLALIPALGLIFYSASEQRRAATIEVQNNALRLAKLVANNQQQIVESSRQLLTVLAQVPAVRAATSPACDRLLANLLQQYPSYATFGVFDAQGNPLCNALPYQKSVNIADRRYFRRALQSRQFAIGGYQIGRISQKETINFAYPLVDQERPIQKVIVAALDLAQLNDLAAQIRLPPDSVLSIVDSQGMLLARYPDPTNWVGKPLPGDNLDRMRSARGEGVYETTSLDGVARIFAFVPLGNAPSDPYAYVRMGIPASVAYADANRLLLRNLITLGAVTLLALITAWIGSDMFVLRQLRSLVQVTQRLREGDLSARSDLTPTAGELGQLAQAFNSMADSLEQRVNELQTLFDVIPISIAIAQDQEFHFIQVNQTFATILSIPVSANASFTPAIPQPPPPYRLYRNGRELTLEELPLRVAAMQGQVVNGVDMDVVREDGTVFNLFGYAAPLYDAHKQPRGAVGAFLDITERKQTEAALRRSEERFRISQDLSLDAFTILQTVRNATGQIVDLEWAYVNPKAAQILQRPASELIGQRLLEVLPGNKTNSDLFDRYLQVIETGNPHDIEVAYHSEGITGWFRNMAVKLGDGIAISFSDITERKQAEQQREQLLERERKAREDAEQANRIKDEFLAVLSHELRTPLNPILGWVHLLLNRKLDEVKTRQALETIERNAKLQTQLIEDLLDVSRILRGKLSLNMVPVDVGVAIANAIETVQLAAEAKGIEIRFEPGLPASVSGQVEGEAVASPYRVLGDAGRLQQVVWNLLSNAVKFTPAGGRVEVRVQRVATDAQENDSGDRPDHPAAPEAPSSRPYSVQIQVTDTGKGVKPEFLPFVFDYFRQADSSTTRQFGGLGLGLAIVRHIVELHGGSVSAASPGEDQGATFQVNLPLLQQSSSNPQDSDAGLPPLDQTSPLMGVKIVVVDDDPDAREWLSLSLQQFGATVTQAASAAEAWAEIAETRPDICLSDIGMPGADGYALLRYLRNLPPEAGGRVPVIAVTAYAGDTNRTKALAAGFQAHLSKPVDPQQMVREIVKVLQTLPTAGVSETGVVP